MPRQRPEIRSQKSEVRSQVVPDVGLNILAFKLDSSMSTMSERAATRGDWSVRKFDSLHDLRRQQIADWQALSGEERRVAAWELAVEYFITKGGLSFNELRLQRSVGYSRKA